jgi:hypothetical protein
MKFLSRTKKTKTGITVNKNESVSKEMLGKVLGGGGGSSAPDTVDTAIVKSKSNISNN